MPVDTNSTRNVAYVDKVDQTAIAGAEEKMNAANAAIKTPSRIIPNAVLDEYYDVKV